MIQPASETAKAMKKSGGKSIRQAAEAEALQRGRTHDGDSSWSPKRLDAEEAAAESKSRRTDDVGEVRPMPLELIRVAKGANPRTHFDQAALDELAASIESTGLAQPILVRPVDDGYELIAGERRLRAFRQLKRKFIPANVRELTDAQAVEIRAMENLARADLNPIEAATAYRQILDATGESQAQLAKRLGCSQPKIAHAVALLKIPELWRRRVIAGEINPSDARQVAPWVDRPTVLERLDAIWQADVDASKQYREVRSDFADLLKDAVYEATAELSGSGWHAGSFLSWKIDVDKLDADTLAALDLVEVGDQRRAANLELCDRLADAAREAAIAKAEKKAKREQAKRDKALGIEPETERGPIVTTGVLAPSVAPSINPRAAEQRAEQLTRFLTEWRVDWLRKLIEKAMPIGVARRLFQWAWVELSTHDSGYSVEHGSLPHSARRELFRELAGEAKRGRGSWIEVTEPWAPERLDQFEFAVARRLLVKDGEALPHVPADLVEELAAELKINEEARWEWTADFLELFRKDELVALADELKVDAFESEAKKTLVERIVNHAPRQRPKILVAIATKAARKGGRS